MPVKKKPSAAQLAARAKFVKMVRAKAAAKKAALKVGAYKKPKLFKPTKKQTAAAAKRLVKQSVAVKKVSEKKIGGWYKGTTAFIEQNEKKKSGKKNIKVTRNPKGSLFYPGAFNNFATLSGYKEQKEIIVGKIGNLTMLKSLAPEVKLRILRGKKVNTIKIKSAKDSIDILRKYITPAKVQTQEFMVAMYLNNNNNVLAVYQFGMGGFTGTVMDIRLLMAAALKLGAVAIILCHNHPSGNLTPSQADKDITREVVKVANIHHIKLLDHIILTKESYFSFAEQGILQ
jgi:DNA repair protein RadC